MATRRPPRLPRFDYRGPHRYLLTFCTFSRTSAFADTEAVALALGEFRYTAARESFAILAYCFMDDHVHLLLEGRRSNADLKRCARLMKQRSGFRFRHTTGRMLWQDSYYDRVLRSDEATFDVVRYIFENPVRAGLVRSPADYPFLGSDVWSVEEILAGLEAGLD